MTVKRNVIIKNKSGLHARPAAIFVQIANKYDCEITVRKGRQNVNGKSIMGIMMLAAEKGSRVTIVAKGSDAERAAEDLEGLLLSETLEEFDAKR